MRSLASSLAILFLILGPWTRNAAAGETAGLTIYAYVPRCPLTASGQRPKPGMIAVSRDLRGQGWVFGRRVAIAGLGQFVIADLMHPRHRRSLDIVFPSKAKAVRFGRQKRPVELLDRWREALAVSGRCP
jgi:3D (Asp-Asp-Asp) domain-containing protein